MIQIAVIVEGRAEVEAAPILLRRLALKVARPVLIHHPIRVPRNRIVKPGELERAVLLAAKKVGAHGFVLVLLDADDDCPAILGPALAQRARTVSQSPVVVALAKSEFEGWFVAAAASLAGKRGLPASLAPPAFPEAIRGAKEWLRNQMSGNSYTPTLDQPALAAEFSFDEARAGAPSFDRLLRRLEPLLA